VCSIPSMSLSVTRHDFGGTRRRIAASPFVRHNKNRAPRGSLAGTNHVLGSPLQATCLTVLPPKTHTVPASTVAVSSNLLSSWKEISQYLKCGVRTAQRYERFGLPVHRASVSSRAAVRANAKELDRWLYARSEKRSPGLPNRLSLEQRFPLICESLRQSQQLQAQLRASRTEMRDSRMALQATVVKLRGSLAVILG
jgi:hypothetical protein